MQQSLGFGPDSVILTVKDIVHEMEKGSEKNSFAISERAFVSKIRIMGQSLGPYLNLSNQQGTFEMSEEVFASAGAQEMDTSGFELSDL